MVVKLFTLMPWGIMLTLLVLIAITIALLAFFWVRRITDQVQLRRDQEIASYTLNTIALFYCLLMGLVVLNVQERHNNIEDTVVKEAALIMNLYRICNEFPEFNGPNANKALRSYVEYILNEEWPLMHTQTNLTLQPAIHSHHLWKELLRGTPQDFKGLALYQEILTRMNDLTEARFDRLNSTDSSISLFLWAILIYGGIIVIGCSYMFASQSIIEHVVQICFSVSFLVIVLLLILALDTPFYGPAAISQQPFQHVLERMQSDEALCKIK